MKLEQLKFSQSASQRVYDGYMRRITKALSVLPKSDRQDVLMEFNSHIFEGTQNNQQDNEIDTLLDILDKLGTPEEVLKPLIADKKLEQATKTFNPVHIFKALVLNITNSTSYIIFFILYLCLFGFLFIVYAKITHPSEVGLFFDNNTFIALGKINPEYINNTTTREVLGGWFIPVIILAILLSYILITLLLKLKRTINKK